MNIRWWRMGVVYEDAGDPWTGTLHVRAFQESGARRIVAARVGRPHAVYTCAPSEPLLRVKNVEEIVAQYGPYRRSWDDETVTHLRALLGGPGPTSTG